MKMQIYIKDLKSVMEIICILSGLDKNCTGKEIQEKNFTIYFRRICSQSMTQREDKGTKFGTINDILKRKLFFTMR